MSRSKTRCGTKSMQQKRARDAPWLVVNPEARLCGAPLLCRHSVVLRNTSREQDCPPGRRTHHTSIDEELPSSTSLPPCLWSGHVVRFGRPASCVQTRGTRGRDSTLRGCGRGCLSGCQHRFQRIKGRAKSCLRIRVRQLARATPLEHCCV